ncbi:hypothetical protein MLD38_029017 [Melastoma candidum]|nr:hypothetical protein MLD38_029017 [Melastoma candidum]
MRRLTIFRCDTCGWATTRLSKKDPIPGGSPKEEIEAISQPEYVEPQGKEKEVPAPVEDDTAEELVEDGKRHLNVVFIGHFFLTDAGKSTIGGQILFLSGQVDDHTIQKYEKEAKDKSRESW